MKDHKLQYEATLNFRCTKPLHPSEWKCITHTKTSTSVGLLLFRKTCREKREGSSLMPNTFWSQNSTTNSHPRLLTPPARCLVKSTLTATREHIGHMNVGGILFGWHINVAQWFIGSSVSCERFEPRAGKRPPCWRVPEQSAASLPAPGTVTLGLWSLWRGQELLWTFLGSCTAAIVVWRRWLQSYHRIGLISIIMVVSFSYVLYKRDT